MDPDAEAEQIASQILKTMIVVIVFASCHSNQPKKHVSPIVAVSKKDTIVSAPIAKKEKKKKHKKTVYLTFDDGPNKGTRKVMNIIKQEEVPVTMFLIGEQVYGSREQQVTFDSILKCTYIETANHSFTHGHHQYVQFYAVPDSVVKDFIRCADSLRLTSGVIRTPGRNIWRTGTIHSTDIAKSTAAADSLFQNGFDVMGWDLEWHYDNNMNLTSTSDEMLRQVDSLFAKNKTKTSDNLVLLAHDQVYADATDSAELHDFIKALKAKDEYDIDFISNYPTVLKE